MEGTLTSAFPAATAIKAPKARKGIALEECRRKVCIRFGFIWFFRVIVVIELFRFIHALWVAEVFLPSKLLSGMNFSSPYFAEKTIAWQGEICKIRRFSAKKIGEKACNKAPKFSKSPFYLKRKGNYGENLSIDWKEAAKRKSYLAQRQGQKEGRHRHAHYGSDQAAVFSQLAASEGNC